MVDRTGIESKLSSSDLYMKLSSIHSISSKEIFVNTNTTTICEGIKWAIVTSVLDAGYQKVKEN